jgi:hypothetical protein
MAGVRIDAEVGEYKQRRKSFNRAGSSSNILVEAFDAKTKAVGGLLKLRIQPGDIAKYASKYRLDFSEVRDILGWLAESDASHSEGIDKDTFAEILRKIFNLKAQAMPSNIVDEAWSRMDFEGGKSGSDKASPESFLQWYSENMFNPEIRDLCLADAASGALAKKHNVSLLEIEKIQRIFSSFDLDGSGRIDREEFRLMLMSVFKGKTIHDVSPERANRFWVEMKQDASLTISFPEFCSWYIANFPEEDQDGDFATVASKLYIRSGSCEVDAVQPEKEQD